MSKENIVPSEIDIEEKKTKLNVVSSENNFGRLSRISTLLGGNASAIKADGLPRVEMGKAYPHDTTVLVPFHNEEGRIKNSPRLFRSIKDQDTRINVVIADNGVSADGIEKLKKAASELDLPLTIIDAHPKKNDHKSPAHARNEALKKLASLREEHEVFRGPILELDSDNVLHPGAVSALNETLRAHADAVAVSSTIVSVKSLEPEVLYPHTVKADGHRENGKIRVLPSLWKGDGTVGINEIVAFSSQIAGKTTGILIDPDALFDIVEYSNGSLYVTMPNKSAEDMIASTAFSRHGKIYHDGKATVFDMERETMLQTEKQQMDWGRDHVFLADALAKARLTSPGVHVLEPKGKVWVEWTVPKSEDMTAYVVNPADIAKTLSLLRQDLGQGKNINGHSNTELNELLSPGLEITGRLLERIRQADTFVMKRARTDLPKPITEDPENARFAPHAKKARLAGNLIGARDVNPDIEDISRSGQMPRVILLGGRQAASW